MKQLNSLPFQLLLNYVQTAFDPGNVGTYTPLVYQGAIAGSEFLTYDAKKLYICCSVGFMDNATPSGAKIQTSFYDAANAVVLVSFTAIAFYNTTAAAINYQGQLTELTNLYFSRVVASSLYIKFIGYKITLP
jgi:hypothetical protein